MQYGLSVIMLEVDKKRLGYWAFVWLMSTFVIVEEMVTEILRLVRGIEAPITYISDRTPEIIWAVRDAPPPTY